MATQLAVHLSNSNQAAQEIFPNHRFRWLFKVMWIASAALVIVGSIGLMGQYGDISALKERISLSCAWSAFSIGVIGLIFSSIYLYRTRTPSLTYQRFSSEMEGPYKGEHYFLYKKVGDYVLIRQVLTNDRNDWVLFQRDLQKEVNDSNKVHISIDNDQMAEAFKIIYPLLMREKISCFKIVPENTLRREQNCNGKEFVIYFDGKDDPQFWKTFLREIAEKLQRANIRPGRASLGDVPIEGGNNYFSSRITDNFAGRYVPADSLAGINFTREEAALLSENQKMIALGMKQRAKSVSVLGQTYFPRETNSTQHASSIHRRIQRQLYPEFDEIYSGAKQAISFKVLLLGGGNAKYNRLTSNKDDPEARLARYFYGEEAPGQPICPEVHGYQQIIGVGNATLRYSEVLFPLMWQVANTAALLAHRSNKKLDDVDRFPSVLPALYHHLFKSLYEIAKVRELSDNDVRAYLNENQKRTLVKRMVEALFREPSRDFSEDVEIEDAIFDAAYQEVAKSLSA